MKKVIIFSLTAMGLGLITLLILSRFYHRAGDIEIERAKNNNEIVIIDFWAKGCSPCKKVSPIMDEIAVEYPSIEVMKVDINSEKDLHNKYEIKFVPTVIIFYKGEEFTRLIGFHEKQEYVKNIEALLNLDESVMMKFEWNGERQ
jgi:thioredoxin 1